MIGVLLNILINRGLDTLDWGPNVAEFPSAEVLNTLGWGTKTGPNISGFNARQIQFGAG